MRPNDPNFGSVFAAYEKIIGCAPTAEQLRRLDRIRASLELRDDDALWSIVLTLEHYFKIFTEVPRHYEEAGRAQAEALRERILAGSDPRHILGEPIMLRIFTVSALIAVIVSIIGILTIIHFEDASNKAALKWAHEYVNLADEKLQSEFDAAVEKRVAEEMQPVRNAKRLLDDPEANSLIRAVASLGRHERDQLLLDPAWFQSILKALAPLAPTDRTFLLEAASSPHAGLVMQLSRWVVKSVESGDQSLARMLAGYAASNKKLNQCIAALPSACTLDHYRLCR